MRFFNMSVILGTGSHGTGLQTLGADRLEMYRLAFPRTLPPKPDDKLIPLVNVPQPAQIPEDMSDSDQVRMLATSYRDSLQLVDPKNRNSYFLRVRDPAEHKDYHRLLSAASFMRGNSIAPFRWCAFSCRAWNRKANKGNVYPTPSFVFSGSRLVERLGWFLEDDQGFSPSGIQVVREHQVLLDRYAAMADEIVRANPRSSPEILGIVDAHFPEDTFERSVGLAVQASRRLQASLNDAVALGGSPWSKL